MKRLIFLIGFSTVATQVSAAPLFVQSTFTFASGVASVTATTTNTITTGNLAVILGGNGSTSIGTTSSDTANNTWTEIIASTNSSVGIATQRWATLTNGGGSTDGMVLHLNSATTALNVVAYELSGLTTSNPVVEISSSVQVTSGTIVASTFTLTNSRLVVIWCQSAGNANSMDSSQLTVTNQVTENGNRAGIAIAPGGGSFSATCRTSASAATTITMAAFNPTSTTAAVTQCIPGSNIISGCMP